jgi:hypothetical protein
MGLAAGLAGVQPAFLRSLDAAGLLTPRTLRRRPTPLQPRRTPLAQQVRALLDQNMPLALDRTSSNCYKNPAYR